MAANKTHRSLATSALLGLLLGLLLSGCNRGGGTVRHGHMVYNATEVFGTGKPALALAAAAARGDVQELNHLVEAGANVNSIGQHGITPLWWAAFAGNYEGFAALLDKGANPNAQRMERYPIMIWVANMEDHRFLEASLKHGGDPNLRDIKTGETPIFLAVRNDLKPQVDLLLAAKADVNVQLPASGMTLPIVAIASRADYQISYRLLQAGADPTLKMNDGRTLADAIETVSINASNNDDPWRAKVIEYLRSKGMTVREPPTK